MNLPAKESAFASARVRFLAGLRAKAAETSRVVESYLAEPGLARSKESLRRHLHALSASAQLFGLEKLGEHISAHIALLDTQDANAVDSYRWRSLPMRYLDLVRDAGLPVSVAPPSVAEEPETGAFRKVGAEMQPPQPLQDQPHVQTHPTADLELELESESGAELESEREQKISEPVPVGSNGVDHAALDSDLDIDLSFDAELESVVTVLVIDDPVTGSQISAALSDARYEVMVAETADIGLHMLRHVRPDAVFVHERWLTDSAAEATEWQTLRQDAELAKIPLIWLFEAEGKFDSQRARQAGAAAALQKPLHPSSLERIVKRVTQSGSADAQRVLGELTLREFADRLADEMRRGVLRDAQGDRGATIAFGEGSDVLAPIWSAIARVRQSVSERTQGEIRYGSTSTGRTSRLLSLTHQGEAPSAPLVTSATALEGRIAVIADDDPAVVWFFAGVLREVGMQAYEAYDGAQALDAALRYRPDVIIADILMPRLDGLSLCTALQKEPLLHEIPVILTSWRDDFLERVRELQSGAQAYLRKEAGAHDVIARIEEVLAPRLQLEERLRSEGEVRGRMDGISLVHFLESVKQHMPDARVLLRDAWSLFEIHIANSRIVEINRTAADGSFVRNERAVSELLGVRSARFTAMRSEWQRPIPIDRDYEHELDIAARRLSAMIRALTVPALSDVATIEFEPDAIASYCQSSPEQVRGLIRQIAEGTSPAELLANDRDHGRLLERVLLNAAKRGAIRSVTHRDGVDIVTRNMAERLNGARPVVSDLPNRLDQLIEGGAEKLEPIELQAWKAAEPPEMDHTGDQQVVRESLRSASTVAMVQDAANQLPNIDLFDNARDRHLTVSDAPAHPPEPRRSFWRRERFSSGNLVLAGLLVLAVASLWAVNETLPISLERSTVQHASRSKGGWINTRGLPVSRTDDLYPSQRIDQILAVGVPVAPGQGLLVIESANSDVPTQLLVDGESVGAPPYAGALLPGVHEVEIRRGAQSEFRYYRVTEASTRVISLP